MNKVFATDGTTNSLYNHEWNTTPTQTPMELLTSNLFKAIKSIAFISNDMKEPLHRVYLEKKTQQR